MLGSQDINSLLAKDSFKIFNLDYKFNIDLVNLKIAYHDLQKLIHPDKHRYSSPELLDLIKVASAKVNQAYLDLLNPLSRGRLLLSILASEVELPAQSALPQNLLLQQMDIHEQIANYAAAKDSLGLESLITMLNESQAAIQQGLSELFVQHSWLRISEELNSLSVYQKLSLVAKTNLGKLLNLE